MKKYLLLFSLLILWNSFQGQEKKDKPLRIEIPARTEDESHRIQPCSEQGVMIYFKSVEKEQDTLVKWYFSMYDVNLKHQWLKSVPIPGDFVAYRSLYEQGKLHFCFVKESTKSSSAGFLILLLDPVTGVFTATRGDLPGKAEPADFIVAGNKVFFGYNAKEGAPGVRIIDPQTHQVGAFEWANGSKGFLTGLRVDTLSNHVFGYLKRSFSKNKYEYFISETDFSGKLIRDILVNDPSSSGSGDIYILDVKTMSLDEDELIAYGAYRTGMIRNQDKNNLASPATGIYFLRIENGQIRKSAFTNFLTLGNGVFPGKGDAEDLQKKASRKNKNISDYSLDYSVNIRPLVRAGRELILIAELFTPQFHVENYTNFDYYGRPSTNSYRVFDGYRYTNGMILGLDTDGNILWNNGIEIVNLITFDPDPRLNLTFTHDSAQILSYLSQGKIGYKVLERGKVLEKLDFATLELMNPEDKLLSESRSNMRRWYDNNFLCYGYQEIKNINASENKKRIVFFLTKVQSE